MWFKNIRVFCLIQPFDLSFEDLESQLAENPFIPCANYEKSRIGWVSPLGDAAPELAEDQEPMLSHIVGDYIMLCAQKQERLLPASVVREATAEKVAEIEMRQARKVYRKEKREIQDNMYASLLPRAFTRSTRIYAYISRADNLLVVDAVSAPKAEEFINLLRDSLGSFPVAIPDSKRAPSDVMTRWLVEQKATDKFEIHSDCELFNPLDGSNVVRFKGQDLVSDEIKTHLEAGKRAKQLSVMWGNVLSCSIAEDLSLKRLRFENINEESASFEEESAAQKFDQEFVLMTLELSGFFKSFFNAFGGLEDPKNKVLPDNRDKEPK
ncbi:recombination-associated protein RdgC [Haliea sp. AH-315-K21]|uniref:Recombination-associated protein RdgC n=1 Tax=SAR86 cluster bacterium TaxID=2030880 RepID=A0A2A5CEV5_9GAMM|nr:recombination-associated protein RdgC [Haliea sp. AH-315-K21]PCJ42048.1 MAG: recombination-associated protein RdgC [SAR86 cluster bacterium]